MHDVVLMAVNAAVRNDMTNCITVFQSSLFFIEILKFKLLFFFCLDAKETKNQGLMLRGYKSFAYC